MTGRRGDAVYFGVFAVAAALAFWATRGEEEATAAPAIDFSLPGIELEIPFDLPFVQLRFKRPEVPRLELAKDTEGVIVEVREALLESSAREDDDVEVSLERGLYAPRLAAAFE